MKSTTKITPPRFRSPAPMVRSTPALTILGLGILALGSLALGTMLGCERGMEDVRAIQSRRNQQQRSVAEHDHIREAIGFLSQFAELDPETAKHRISGLLNAWLESHPIEDAAASPRIVNSLDPPWASEPSLKLLDKSRFSDSDVEYVKLNYVLRKIADRVMESGVDDPLWNDWIDSLADRSGDDGGRQLRQAARLFDWTVRNVALETAVDDSAAPPAPDLPAGLEFRGAGYRQTPFETLSRGRGDAWQRARIFIQLCRQSSIDACVLGLAGASGSEPRPWLVGVRIGTDLFLFDPQLGIPVPGPEEVGIATLEEARKDESVLRRLNVPGWFDYPVDAKQIQQTIAWLDAPAESLSARMAHLEAGLTGDARMVLAYDADSSAKAFDAVPGVAGARLWPIDIQARLYQKALRGEAANNRQLAAWMAFQWGVLDHRYPLAGARWKHLTGQFESEDSKSGAQVSYMQLRLPEFDIERLPNSPELQERYNPILHSRRVLGESEEEFSLRMQNLQFVLQLSKRAATYWISLIHYETGAYEAAENWLQKRVLDEDLESTWKAPARYNLARAQEQLGELDQAVERLKTIGDPQEHGNRIRARLVQRQIPSLP